MVKKLKHIVIAISASLVLCAGFVPSVPSPFRTASAGEDIGFAGGSGTADDPYLVKTPEHLDNVRGHLDAHFRQVADIDLSGYTERQGWEPIRNRSETFKGTFDGSKYKISNLTINRRNSSYIGLFGIVDNTATVKRIGLENVDIVGKYEVGALAGRNMGKITECYVKGTIAGEGGIGGLVGNHQGNITYSYAKIDVFGGNYAGGMVGGNAGGRIEDCFVVGTVTGDTGVGSLVGRNMGKITGSYYDERIIGRDETDKGIPKTTEEMMIRETFEGWNFENVWKIDEEENYPYLQWEKWDKSDIPVLPAVEEKKAEKISDELKEPVRRVKSEIAERFAGGSGAEDDPYLLETPEQLDLVRNHLDAHFRQIADIDLSEYSDGKGWMPIGDDDNAFNGTVDGNGYKIVNLTINRPENSYVGFFGTLGQNSEVNNVSLKDVDVRGYRWSGALGGENEGKITSSNVDGKVKWGLVSGGGMVGGIVASNKGSIKNSFATVKLKGQYFVGGVVGENR